MRRRWLLLTLLLVIAACVRVEVVEQRAGTPRVAVERFVSNVGSATLPGGGANDCTSSSTPCHFRRATTVAACGDTITLLDGTYQGDNYLMDFRGAGAPTNKVCSSGARMTVRAQNDGGALIDGQGARFPVFVYQMSYWTFQGFNARKSNDGVVFVRDSDNIQFKRIVAWDAYYAPGGNSQVVSTWVCTDCLFEDVGAFGTGIAAVVDYDTTRTTWRRIWARSEGSQDTNNSTVTNQWNYNNNTPNSAANLVEDQVQVFAGARVFGSAGTNWYVTNFNRDAAAAAPYSRYYGGLHYLIGSSTTLSDVFLTSTSCPGFIIQDQAFHTNGRSLRPMSVLATNTRCSSAGGAPMQITRATSITPTASSTGAATVTNLVEASTLAGTQFNYQGQNNTAQLCFETVDGVLTSTKLWPWRMDDRIKAAIASNAGSGSPALVGGAGSGYAAGTPTSEVASLFGPIPAACNRTGGVFVPNFPVVTDFPSTDVIDTFDRPNGALGSNWTYLAGAGGFIVQGNQAIASGPSRVVWNAGLLPPQHEAYATWTTVPPDTTTTTSVMIVSAATTTDDTTGWHLVLDRGPGSNDQLKLARITGGYTEIWGPIDLGGKVTDGNLFGVRISPTQTISVYWRYNGVTYRVGSVIDTNLPITANQMIGMGGAVAPGVVINDFGGTSTGGVTPTPGNIGRFGSRFPTQ